MGKAEGSMPQRLWHGHVTAVTVATEFRRLGVAAKLMNHLEEVSEKCETACIHCELFLLLSR